METIIESKLENPSLSHLANEAKLLEGDQKFMEPGTIKKKRGRPSKEERAQKAKLQSESAKQTTQIPSQSKSDTQTQAPLSIPSKEIAKPFCQLISKAGAAYVEDQRAQMTPEELENVANAMGMVMDKWMPFLSNQYGAELYLVVALGSWGTRLYAFKKLKAEEKKAQKQKEDLAKAHNSVESEPQPFPEHLKVNETVVPQTPDMN